VVALALTTAAVLGNAADGFPAGLLVMVLAPEAPGEADLIAPA
jgi:hypothetical protein